MYRLLFFVLSLNFVACGNDNVVSKVVEKDNTIAEGDEPGECADGEDWTKQHQPFRPTPT